MGVQRGGTPRRWRALAYAGLVAVLLFTALPAVGAAAGDGRENSGSRASDDTVRLQILAAGDRSAAPIGVHEGIRAGVAAPDPLGPLLAAGGPG